MKHIGIISDTHGLLRQQAIEAMQGVDLIIHAGDVGALSILEDLRAIAPVEAVRGNTDTQSWAFGLKKSVIVDYAGTLFFVIHDISEIDLDPAVAGIKVVVHGHSHRSSIREENGVLFINPGSAGPIRFSLPRHPCATANCGEREDNGGNYQSCQIGESVNCPVCETSSFPSKILTGDLQALACGSFRD